MACGADPQGAACVQAVTNALKAAEFYSDPTKSLLALNIGGYSVVERYLRNGGMDGHAQEAYAKAVYGHREDVIELLEEFLPSTQHTQSQLATANMLMAGIPMGAILAGEGMAICIASPACRAGLATLEVSDCAINPDPTCVTPGPSLPKPNKNTGSAGQNNGKQTANNNGGNGNVGEAPNRTGTVWDNIASTAGNIPNTQIPATFKLTSGSTEFYVNSNATKHMGEYLQRSSNTINDQQLLSSFSGAVDNIASSGAVKFNHVYNVDGWEIIFNQRVGDQLPVVKHALYRP